MAPADLVSSIGPVGAILVQILIGFGFGFMLEISGFGDSRKLAGQFYLRDMTVLKVMFGAIVVTAVLMAASIVFGWIDFSRVYVDHTYWGSGLLGGLLLGFGFAIGGFCPGTAWTSSATFKVDAWFFIGGVLLGIWAFGETVPQFWSFYNTGGERLTIPDWLGWSFTGTVLVIVVVAILAFWLGEKAERKYGKGWVDLSREHSGPKLVAAAALTVFVLALFVHGDPTLDELVARHAPEQDARIEARQIQADPGEVLGLMYNKQIAVVLLDCRDEAEYNLFHLLGARHIDESDLTADWVKQLNPDAVKIIMSDDEERAEWMWRRLDVLGVTNLYILAGGVNGWIATYCPQVCGEEGIETAKYEPNADETKVHFPMALGDRYELARPEKEKVAPREFTPVVKIQKATRDLGGGCG